MVKSEEISAEEAVLEGLCRENSLAQACRELEQVLHLKELENTALIGAMPQDLFVQ
jgi:hypothetical protein